MAVAHSQKAGQWSKGQSRDVNRRTFLMAVAVLYLFGMACAFIAGYAIGNRPRISVIAALVFGAVAVALFVATSRWLERRFDAASGKRLRFLRGGQAEAYVSMMLRHDLPDEWHVFDNVMLDDKSDVDHVVVGPRGLFIVSTKASRGLFRGGPDGSRMNDQPTDWPRKAVQQALRLRDQLNVVAEGSVPWVQPVLALPHAYVDAPGKPPQAEKAWVLHEDNLCEHLEAASGRLRPADVQRLVAAVKTLVDRRTPAGHLTSQQAPAAG